MLQEIPDLKALGLISEPSERVLEAFRAIQLAEQAAPEIRRKREKRDAALNAVYRRYSGRNAPEAARQEELLSDARRYAEMCLEKALAVSDCQLSCQSSEADIKAACAKIRDQIVLQVWQDFLREHKDYSDFRLGFREFEAALWIEGFPSLGERTSAAIQRHTANRICPDCDNVVFQSQYQWRCNGCGAEGQLNDAPVPDSQSRRNAENSTVEPHQSRENRVEVQPNIDTKAWAERNQLSGEYLPRIATASEAKRRELICELAIKLFGSWAKRRVNSIRSVGDIHEFDREQDTCQSIIVRPHFSGVLLNEQDRTALDTTLAGCRRTWLSRAIERTQQDESETPASISRSAWSRVKALDSSFKTRLNQGAERDRVVCEHLQRCFDTLAEDHFDAGLALDFVTLRQVIPQTVFAIAIKLEWLPSDMDSNLIIVQEWSSRLFEGWIAYFEACEIGRNLGHQHNRPDFVLIPVPEIDPLMQAVMAYERLRELNTKESFVIPEEVVRIGVEARGISRCSPDFQRHFDIACADLARRHGGVCHVFPTTPLGGDPGGTEGKLVRDQQRPSDNSANSDAVISGVSLASPAIPSAKSQPKNRSTGEGDEKKATERQTFMSPHIAPTQGKRTLNALAEQTGIAQSSLSRWHNGRQRLSDEKLGILAAYLKTEPKDIPN